MRPQENGGLSWCRASALPSLRRRLTLAAGAGLSLAVAVLVWSCEGSPTGSGGVTTGSGGGGGGRDGGPPSGYTRVNVGESFQGTVAGSDPVCAGPNYYYVGGPCQRFAIAVSGKAGTLMVQLGWDQPAVLLALSTVNFDGWAECCQSPLSHQMPVSAGTSWVFLQVMLVGPKDPTGTTSAAASQKFTLTTSFSPQ